MAEAAGLRRVQVDRPFTDGYVSDLPPEMLGPRMAARMENMIFPAGVARRRRGRPRTAPPVDTSIAGGAGLYEAAGFARLVFSREGSVRDLYSLRRSGLSTASRFYHGTASGNMLASPLTFSAVPVLPRCVYRDELLLCAQDGVTPLTRWGGATAPIGPVTGVTATSTAGTRTLTYSSPTGVTVWSPGLFVSITSGWKSGARGVDISLRTTHAVVGAPGTITVERAVFESGATVPGYGYGAVGYTWPGVPVYSSGTLTAPSGGLFAVTATGVGVNWSAATGNLYANDVVLGSNDSSADGVVVLNGVGAGAMNWIDGVTNPPTATTFQFLSAGYAAPSKYKVMRRSPFTDVAVYRNCLFGAGVREQRSRLYYFPPGHDIGLAPYLSDGRDLTYPTASGPYVSSNPEKEFETEWVDVPSAFDGDPIVALLEEQYALYVIKRGSVYRVTGDYPNFRVDKVDDAAGCLDVRSAITDETGIYWCGDTGVWTIRSGQPYNLAGGVNRPGILDEWRKLMADGVKGPTPGSSSRIVCGVAEGHLVVSVQTESVGGRRTYVFDLEAQRWCGTFTNWSIAAAWSSRVAGEADEMHALETGMGTGYRTAVSPAFRSSGLTSDQDGAGSAVPFNAVAHTGSSFFFPGTVSQEHRLVDVGVAAAYHSLTTPTGQVDVKVAYGDAVDMAMGAVQTVGQVQSSLVNEVHRNEFRSGTRGRRHQLQIEQTTVDADEMGLDIHEVTGLVRPFGVRR